MITASIRTLGIILLIVSLFLPIAASLRIRSSAESSLREFHAKEPNFDVAHPHIAFIEIDNVGAFVWEPATGKYLESCILELRNGAIYKVGADRRAKLLSGSLKENILANRVTLYWAFGIFGLGLFFCFYHQPTRRERPRVEP